MDKLELRQYRGILREIEQLEAEKQRVLDSLLAPPNQVRQLQGRSGTDRIGEAVARRETYQNLIDRKLDELLALREQIESAIQGLPAEERRLMRLRYIDGLTWEKIAVALHYSIQHVWREHGRILQKMRDNERV